MKSWRVINRKARRRIPKWKYLRNKINKITREEIFPKLIEQFWFS